MTRAGLTLPPYRSDAPLWRRLVEAVTTAIENGRLRREERRAAAARPATFIEADLDDLATL